MHQANHNILSSTTATVTSVSLPYTLTHYSQKDITATQSDVKVTDSNAKNNANATTIKQMPSVNEKSTTPKVNNNAESAKSTNNNTNNKGCTQSVNNTL